MRNQVTKFYAGCLVLFAFLGFCPAGSAVTLDVSFGDQGLVRTQVGHYMDQAQAVVVQADGRILAAGSSSNNSNLDFALVRYLPDGGLDPSFNVSGQVVTVVGNEDDVALGLALQVDGKIVVCGYTFNGQDRDLALLRFTSNGSLDPEFGVGGVVTLAVGDGDETGSAVAIQPDGGILVSGTMEENSSNVGVLLRFLANGSLDSSFGRAGVVRLGLGETAEISALAVQKDKNIVATGVYVENGRKRVLLARLLQDGTPDPGFGGGDGIAETPSDSRDAVGNGLWVQEDGTLLIAGSIGVDNNQDIALFRFTQDGILDLDFGGGKGVLSHDFNGEDDVGYGVAANAETIFVAGYSTTNGQRDLVLLSSALGSDSQSEIFVVPTGVTSFDGVAYALTPQDGDKLVAVGYSEESGVSSFVMTRYTGKEVAGIKSNVPGTESSYIITAAITEITRVGCFTGGEILGGSGLTFADRGVVYSIAPYPVLATGSDATTVPKEDVSKDSTLGTSVTSPTAKATTISGSSSTVEIEGSTSNGAGEGRYSSILSGLTPGKMYYVRAYGITSDDEVYYGNQLSFETKDACFIATAAYGSLLDPHVQTLRLFRDQYLLTHGPGRIFVTLYYHYSPPLADFIAEHPVLRFLVRIFLFPLIAWSSMALHLGIMGMSVVMLAVSGMVVIVWRRMRQKKMRSAHVRA
jgi:uncharacterized delta-60 repeat protein